MISLRRLRPDDGEALRRLLAVGHDTGRVPAAPRYVVDPYSALVGLETETVGVVAEGDPGIVGLALVRFGRCRVAGDMRSYALLHNLLVDPDCRRRGIAGLLLDRRLELVRKKVGEEALLLANLQVGNVGSFRTAQRWARQFLGPLVVTGAKVRSSRPRLPADLTVESLGYGEEDRFAQHLDRFYRRHNFYPSLSGEELERWRRRSPLSRPFRHFRVVRDSGGQLLAGMAVSESYRLQVLHVARLPPVLRVLNAIARFVPPDGEVRQLTVSRLWFAPGNWRAIRLLWRHVRWEWRDRAGMVMTRFDPRDGWRRLLGLPPWTPRGEMNLAVRAPAPVSEHVPLYPL